MEGKVLLQDLAQSLAAKRKIQRKDSETFLKAFFETISEGILQDKIVKIKGLGTFKMIEVQDRESVNVNTGERIVIPGHSKITFTPDTELKDEVNKPFALFQTVIINEGTSIEDMEKVDKVESIEPKEESEEPIVESVAEVPAEPVVAVTTEETESPDIPETPETPEKPEFLEVPLEPAKREIPLAPEVEPVSSGDIQSTVQCKRSWWYVSPAMTALLFAFFWIVGLMGYFIGSNNWIQLENIFQKSAQEPIVQVDTVYVEKVVKSDSVYIQNLKDSLKNAISQVGKINKEQPKEQPAQVAKPAPKTEAKPASETKKVPAAEQKKLPVAFEIVGYKGSRTIQWGDYLLKIVRQEYGTDDALRYVISYNNFTDPNNLPVGTEIKLPKLKQK
jgi:nucleoid DNA-binding protein